MRPADIRRLIRDGRRWGPLAAALRYAARRRPEACALVDELGELTFAELDRRSNALAWAWRGRGIRQDAAIGVLCRNHRGPVEAVLAAAKLGAQVVLLDPRLDAWRLADIVRREAVTVLVHDEEFARDVAALPDRVERFLAWTDGVGASTSLGELVAAGPTHELPVPDEPGRLATVTPGTRATVPFRGRASRFLERIALPPGGAVAVETSLLGTAGLTPLLASLVRASATRVRRRFDPNGTLECAALVLTPDQLRELVEHQPGQGLRAVVSTAAALPVELGDRATAAFGDVVHDWYGSAACPVITVAMPADRRAAPGTVGRPPAGVEVQLRTPDGRVAGPGEWGAVHARDRQAPAGGTAATGDAGRRDAAGRLFLDGRT